MFFIFIEKFPKGIKGLLKNKFNYISIFMGDSSLLLNSVPLELCFQMSLILASR